MSKIKELEKKIAALKKENLSLKRLLKKKEKESLEKKSKKETPKREKKSLSKKIPKPIMMVQPKQRVRVLDDPPFDFSGTEKNLKFDEGCAHFRYLNGDPDDLNVDVEAIISKSKKTIKLQWVCVDDTYSNWEGRISEDCKKIALLKSEKYPPSVHINLEWGFSEFEHNASCYRGNGVDETGTSFYMELFLE